MSYDHRIDNPDALALAVTRAIEVSDLDSGAVNDKYSSNERTAEQAGRGLHWFEDASNLAYSDGTMYIPAGFGYRKPEGFAWPSNLPTVYAYKNGSNFSCNITPESLIDYSIYTQTYYVDGRSGSDSNSGLTWALRKLSIHEAMNAASASGIPSRILVRSDSGKIIYYRDRSWAKDIAPFVSAVPMIIEGYDGRIVTGAFDRHTFTLTAASTYTYQTARSNTVRVFNPEIKDSNGVYLEYDWAASTAAVEATAGTWFTDNTTVYVHPHNDRPATERNARLYLIADNAGWNNNKNLLVRNFDFEGGQKGAFSALGGSTNNVIFDNCTFRYAALQNTFTGGTAAIDGLQAKGAGLYALFNCKADKNSKDGFNFHNENTVIPSALLVNCSASANGVLPIVSCNGFTTHDGMVSIDIGGTWVGSKGANSAHVSDDTQVWSVGSTAGGSCGDIETGGTDLFGGFAAWQGTTKLWLDSCTDLANSIGVYAANSAAIYLRNHKGTGTRVTASSGTITNY